MCGRQASGFRHWWLDQCWAKHPPDMRSSPCRLSYSIQCPGRRRHLGCHDHCRLGQGRQRSWASQKATSWRSRKPRPNVVRLPPNHWFVGTQESWSAGGGHARLSKRLSASTWTCRQTASISSLRPWPSTSLGSKGGGYSDSARRGEAAVPPPGSRQSAVGSRQ